MNQVHEDERSGRDAFTRRRWDLARLAARVLYHRGARTVWVFGSLAMGKPQDQNSDFDFAVEGFPLRSYQTTRNELSMLLRSKVDLVVMERANHLIRNHIFRTRVLLTREEQ